MSEQTVGTIDTHAVVYHDDSRLEALTAAIRASCSEVAKRGRTVTRLTAAYGAPHEALNKNGAIGAWDIHAETEEVA